MGKVPPPQGGAQPVGNPTTDTGIRGALHWAKMAQHPTAESLAGSRQGEHSLGITTVSDAEGVTVPDGGTDGTCNTARPDRIGGRQVVDV